MKRTAHNPDVQKRAATYRKLLQERLRNDVRHVLATPQGRRFLWWVLEDVCGLHRPSFTGNSETFHREGRRAVGLDLMTYAQGVAPEAYVQALQEHINTASEAELLRQDAESAADEEEDDDGR